MFNVLLQVLDDGRLTDSQGRTVDFSNTVVIMTSNLGSEYLIQAAEAGPAAKRRRASDSGEDESKFEDDPVAVATAAAKKKVMSTIRRHFRPEFLNRLDDIIVFEPLNMETLRRVLGAQVEELVTRLRDRNTRINLSPGALDFVLERGYNPAYGARPLKRFIQKQIVTGLSKLIVSGALPDNSEVTVSVRVVGGEKQLAYSVAALPVADEEDGDTIMT